MSKSYFLWRDVAIEGYCVLDHVENYDDTFRLYDGSRLSGEFPDDVYFPMNPEHPNDIRLADNIPNYNSAIVVSGRIREFIEARNPLDVEFLRVSIHDHKGRVASTDYFVLNPIRVVDCLDVEASDVTWNRINKDRISSCFDPVFSFEKVDDELLLFRVRYRPSAVLVHQSLVDQMSKEDFTGTEFVPTNEIDSL